MRITKLKIKNFRSFDGNDANEIIFPDLKLPFSIVGYNNSGKSNLIKALLLVCGQKDYWKFNKTDFYYEKTNEKVEVEVNFDQAISVPTIYQTDKECWGANLDIRKNAGLISGYNHALGKNGKLIIGQERLKGRGLPVLFSSIKEKLGLYYIDYRNIDKHLQINSSTLLGKILKEVKDDFKSDENKITVNNKEYKREDYYVKLIDHIETKILATGKLNELVKKIAFTLKDQLGLSKDSINLCFQLPDSDQLYDSMSFNLSDCEKKPALPLYRLGDGFKAMLVMAIIQVMIDLNEGGKIIVLEEPETFLHEHYQDYFYSLLLKLAKNNQVIYSTHSKKFVDVFHPESIIKIDNRNFESSELIQPSNPKITVPDSIDDFIISDPNDFPKYLRTLEPNIGNILFANKVIVVEGPLDLLAYKTVLSTQIDFAINNIAIVSAWGKDPIITIIQLCNYFKIPCLVIHDYDLDSESDDSPQDKAQKTKNTKIANIITSERVHLNKRNLESVLSIDQADKNAPTVFSKVYGKTIAQIRKEFPTFLSDNILKFLEE